MTTQDKLTARRNEIERGIEQLTQRIAQLQQALEQARLNLAANRGALQVLDELLAEGGPEDNAPEE
jgi:prefoldin subunit 5